MKRYRYALIASTFSILTCSAGACRALGAPPGSSSHAAPTREAQVAEIFETAAKEGRLSGAVRVGRAGSIIFDRTFGLASFELNAPITASTRFKIYSTTKHFTAAAIMLLQDRGKLKASDRVRQFLPELPEKWDAVTLHHLLTHTSGIPEFSESLLASALPSQADSVLEAVKAMKSTDLQSTPGETFAYSNSGYTILGAVIERASGSSFEQCLTESIFAPARMTRSGVEQAVFDLSKAPPPDFGSRVIPNLASGYNGIPFHPAPTSSKMYVIQGAGGIYSTINDLWNYSESLRKGEVLPRSTQERMTATPHSLPSGTRIGYGWFIRERHGRTLLSHSGGSNGYVTEFALVPAEHLCIIILSNLGYVNPEALRDEVLEALLADATLPGEPAR